MISICIPVYNFNILKLIEELHKQLVISKKDYEFIIFDDCSHDAFKIKNRKVEKYPNVIYKELEKNVGRAKIRNLISDEARFEHLLFMDCDSEIVSDNFIATYLDFCKDDIVVCGGRVYQKHRPEKKELILRWLYGTRKESIAVNKRLEKPNHAFMTNNFLISKSIISKIKFDESLIQYGHEDTLFGYELFILGINIQHINNPLMHIGLETNIEFINKTKLGILNLVDIINKYPYQMLWENIKLLHYYKKVNKLRIKWLFKISYYLFSKLLLLNLLSSSPSIKVFDLYKLTYLCTMKPEIE